MQVVKTISAVRAKVKAWHQQNLTVAIVPTMGNLHQGHLSLVEKAKSLADRVVVSIFVNPMQFDDPADLKAYPKTLEQDVRQLTLVACDVAFTPNTQVIYPNDMKSQTVVNVPSMDDKLCGAHRPGHFDGVATVVLKFCNIVQADFAVFGEKDYQQLLLIKQVVNDLNLPIEIMAAETFREENGLAMSSRNQYLSDNEKEQATFIYRCLSNIADKLKSGERDFDSLQKEAIQQLNVAGFEPEYVEIRRAVDLALPQQDDKELRILLAVRLGKARLIDNIACNLA